MFCLLCAYAQTQLRFLNIDNIHVVRNALGKTMELLAPNSQTYDDTSFGSKLCETKWLHYVRLILASAQRMARILEEEGASVLCHCSGE